MLSSWKTGMLSQAMREVLIKAVAQAIPTYIMSCFAIPNSICDNMESLICRFWWGGNEDTSKTHWVSWKKLCKWQS